MPEIRETKLPGVGIEFEFTSECGDHVGVISRHSGRREVVVYDDEDPDAVAARIELTPAESAAVAELLGGTRITAQLAALSAEIEGLFIDWLPLSPHFSPITIADTEMRTRTGSSVIAIIRDGSAVPAPGPDDELAGGDTVVLVGTKEGIAAASDLLSPPSG
jgi:TrkA domain protein